MTQPSLFAAFNGPKLDRNLVGIDELHDDHLRNASAYYGWAVTMAACGHDPCTPQEPMRLPRDWRQFCDD